jgi:guanylate kinase
MRGSLFIVSAPSGAGKTTVLQRLLQEVPGISFSVSHTTRPARQGEVEGKDYYFVSKEQFSVMRDRHLFLEWAEVHGNCYGTGLQTVEAALEEGEDIVLDIDVQGARQVRKRTDATSIFIIPPSMQELSARLSGRGTDSSETVKLRLENSVKELQAAAEYDHVIVNDRVNTAVDMLRAVILARRSAERRNADGTAISEDILAAHG